MSEPRFADFPDSPHALQASVIFWTPRPQASICPDLKNAPAINGLYGFDVCDSNKLSTVHLSGSLPSL